jgi:diguanylate cyclase (GGDEF)-like protein/PAS domain S-box-containing protein
MSQNNHREYRSPAWQAALDAAPDAMILVHENGEILLVNRQATALFGYTPQELIGQSVELLVPDQYRHQHAAHRAHYLGRKTLDSYCAYRDLRGRRKDGSEFLCEITLNPMRADEGTIVLAALRDTTQRRALEHRAAENEIRLRLIGDKIPAVLWTTDRDLRFTTSFGSGLATLGLKPGQVVGMPLTEFFHTDDPAFPALASHYSALRGERSEYDFEWQGAVFHTVVEPLYDADNKLIGTIGIAIDVTESRDITRQLQRSRASFDRTQEISHTGSWEWDIADNTLEWSDETFRIFGVERSAFGGSYEAFLECVHPDDRAIVQYAVDRAINQGYDYDIEHRIVRPDGAVCMVHERAECEYNTEGAVSRMLGAVQDITESKQEQAELERFKSTLDAALDCVFMFDPDTLRFIYVNDGAVEQVGYTRDEMLTMTPVDIKPRYTEEQFREFISLLTTGRHRGLHFETVHRHKNGTDIPVEISLQYISPQGGSPRFVAFVRDIRDRIRDAANLDRLNQDINMLLESTTEGIFGVDARMRCTFINRAACAMLGLQATKVLGKDIHELVHHTREDGSEYPREKSPIYRAIDEGHGSWADNEVLWTTRGDSIPVQYSVNPIAEEGHVAGAVVVFRNIAQARALARKMDFLATHDSLTGLINRHEFEARLVTALDDAKEDHIQHVLCYLDLDQFKVVNDTCGHVAGDELLRQLATLLAARVRQADTLGRLGGDEFGVLLRNCSVEQARRTVNDLIKTVREFRFVWSDQTFALGVSIGLVPITWETESTAAALSAADAACYVAKDSGRNRIHVYERDDEEVARRHGEMQWVSRIQRALEENRFELRYQSILPVIPTGAAREHIEILVTMRDEKGSLVPPGAFLPAAERFNLMPAVDRWVVSHTLHWLRDHPQVLTRLEFCAINLSGNSLSDDNFLDYVRNLLDETGVLPTKICFEITETAAIANLSSAIKLITELKKLRCRFSLDDFGSGMSSFAYLKNLPVDFLKIDGNFIRDIVDDPVDRAMVRAINEVGHVMGLQTIGEFVENQEILAQLREIGVDYAQGYGVARPEPLDLLADGTPARQ